MSALVFYRIDLRDPVHVIYSTTVHQTLIWGGDGQVWWLSRGGVVQVGVWEGDGDGGG